MSAMCISVQMSILQLVEAGVGVWLTARGIFEHEYVTEVGTGNSTSADKTGRCERSEQEWNEMLNTKNSHCKKAHMKCALKKKYK